MCSIDNFNSPVGVSISSVPVAQVSVDEVNVSAMPVVRCICYYLFVCLFLLCRLLVAHDSECFLPIFVS